MRFMCPLLGIECPIPGTTPANSSQLPWKAEGSGVEVAHDLATQRRRLRPSDTRTGPSSSVQGRCFFEAVGAVCYSASIV